MFEAKVRLLGLMPVAGVWGGVVGGKDVERQVDVVRVGGGGEAEEQGGGGCDLGGAHRCKD
jgi:hypothetical protein